VLHRFFRSDASETDTVDRSGNYSDHYLAARECGCFTVPIARRFCDGSYSNQEPNPLAGAALFVLTLSGCGGAMYQPLENLSVGLIPNGRIEKNLFGLTNGKSLAFEFCDSFERTYSIVGTFSGNSFRVLNPQFLASERLSCDLLQVRHITF
jgi:hypothetical protein